jgi:hypothetical protein
MAGSFLAGDGRVGVRREAARWLGEIGASARRMGERVKLRRR